MSKKTVFECDRCADQASEDEYNEGWERWTITARGKVHQGQAMFEGKSMDLCKACLRILAPIPKARPATQE